MQNNFYNVIMKNINNFLRQAFLEYIQDGNVIEIKKNVFANQVSMYQDRQIGYFQLYRYFIKQIMTN